MHVLRSPKRLLGSLAVLMLVWAADLGEVMAVLYAVDIHLSVPSGLLILFMLNLAITVPSTPAQAGALELGAVSALRVLHVGGEPAMAFALLYHALQILPLIAVGLIFEFRLVLGREGAPVATTNGAATDAAMPPGAAPALAAEPPAKPCIAPAGESPAKSAVAPPGEPPVKATHTPS
jgi:hypothetical protein